MKQCWCAGHPKGSLFHGLEIPVHIKASWGGFELVDIAKALFGAALQDPANQKMVLLSESCLPLYPPTLTYAQLISEPKSRINACSNEVLGLSCRNPAWHTNVYSVHPLAGARSCGAQSGKWPAKAQTSLACPNVHERPAKAPCISDLRAARQQARMASAGNVHTSSFLCLLEPS